MKINDRVKSESRTGFSGKRFIGEGVVDRVEDGRVSPSEKEYYFKVKVNFNGTVKSYFILDGEEPIKHRDLIIELWDDVETDIYAI